MRSVRRFLPPYDTRAVEGQDETNVSIWLDGVLLRMYWPFPLLSFFLHLQRKQTEMSGPFCPAEQQSTNKLSTVL